MIAVAGTLAFQRGERSAFDVASDPTWRLGTPTSNLEPRASNLR
jgi:hypothetical protein